MCAADMLKNAVVMRAEEESAVRHHAAQLNMLLPKPSMLPRLMFRLPRMIYSFQKAAGRLLEGRRRPRGEYLQAHPPLFINQ
jgi:hypothetical protein